MEPIGVPSTTAAFPTAPFVTGFSPEALLSVIITIIFIWWAIFTLVAIYHWVRFGRDSWIWVPAVAVHLAVSAWIFVFATGGLH